VHGDGIAGEGVDDERIEALGGLLIEAQAGVALDDLDARLRLAEVAEVESRHPDDEGVDLVEAHDVAGASVGGEGACAEADDADAAVCAGAAEQEAGAALGAVIGGGLAIARGVEELGAVGDLAVQQLARAALIEHTQSAVEVASGGDEAGVVTGDVSEGGGGCEDGGEGGGLARIPRDGAQAPQAERGRGGHQEGKLEVALEDHGRERAGGERAEGAAGGDMAPEAGEAGGRGLAAGELAMGKDADQEEAGGVEDHLDDQFGLEVEVEQGAGHQQQAAEGRGGAGDGAVAIALEDPDEAEEVDEERQDPQERGGGHDLAEMGGGGHEEAGAEGGPGEPANAVLPGRAADERARGDGRIGLIEPGGGGDEQQRFDDEGPEPDLIELAQAEAGFPEEGKGEERGGAGGVGPGGEAIGMAAGTSEGVPVHQERAGSGEDQIGQADGADQGGDQVGGAGAAFNGGAGQQDTGQQGGGVGDGLLAGAQPARDGMGVEVAGEEGGLEEKQARRPDRRRASEVWEKVFPGEWLDEEE